MNIDVKPTLPPGFQPFLEVLNWAAGIVVVVCILAMLIALGVAAWKAATGDRITDAIKGVGIPLICAGAIGIVGGLIKVVLT